MKSKFEPVDIKEYRSESPSSLMVNVCPTDAECHESIFDT